MKLALPKLKSHQCPSSLQCHWVMGINFSKEPCPVTWEGRPRKDVFGETAVILQGQSYAVIGGAKLKLCCLGDDVFLCQICSSETFKLDKTQNKAPDKYALGAG